MHPVSEHFKFVIRPLILRWIRLFITLNSALALSLDTPLWPIEWILTVYHAQFCFSSFARYEWTPLWPSEWILHNTNNAWLTEWILHNNWWTLIWAHTHCSSILQTELTDNTAKNCLHRTPRRSWKKALHCPLNQLSEFCARSPPCACVSHPWARLVTGAAFLSFRDYLCVLA